MNMFKATKEKTPAAYLKTLEEPVKHDVLKLHSLIRKHAPELKAKMWGTIIGYGTYKQVGASGKEIVWHPIGLSAWKSYISFYSCLTDGKQYIAEKYKKELPKASIGKSCIRFKKLADVDEKVIIKIIKETAKAVKQK